MIFLRFLAPLALVLSLLAYLMLPWADRLFLSWSESDLQMRSKLVFSSIEDGLSEALNVERASQLTKRFTELAKDERMIGIGYCDAVGAPKYRNKSFPEDISCPNLTSYTKPDFARKTIKGGPVLVATFPFTATADTAPGAAEGDTPASKHGYLLIVQDMAYAERRSENTRQYIMWFVFGISVLASMITLVVARLTLSRWVSGLRDYVRTGVRTQGLPREAITLTREIR